MGVNYLLTGAGFLPSSSNTPLKIYAWNPKSWRFGSDGFPFQCLVFFRFHVGFQRGIIIFLFPVGSICMVNTCLLLVDLYGKCRQILRVL